MQLSHHREGSGEPLVLLHGIGMRWQWFEPVIALLAPERDVIAIDLPGFGESPVLADDVEPIAPALGAAIATFLDDELEIRPRDAHLFGNSLGGLVALEIAAEYGARSVCAQSPAGFWDARGRRLADASLALNGALVPRLRAHLPRLTRSAVARTLLTAQMAAKPWRIPGDALLGHLESFADAPGWERTRRALSTHVFRRGDALTEAAIPVTIAWPRRDRLLPPYQARRALEEIPRARVIWLNGCGHLPFYDDTQQLADVILAASRTPGAAGAGGAGGAAGATATAASDAAEPAAETVAASA